MTSSTVNLQGVSGNFPMPAPKVQETESSTGFGQILESAASKDRAPETKVQPTQEAETKVENDAPVEETPENTNVSDVKEEPKGITESEKPENVDVPEEDVEEAMAILQSAVLEIQELFCETLGITKEEFAQALDSLGMTEADLLSEGNNVAELVLFVEGHSEVTELLTNENLYHTVQELESALTQIADDVMNELELVTTEDVDAEVVFEQAVKLLEKPVNTSEEPTVITMQDGTEEQQTSVNTDVQTTETNSQEGKSEDGHTDNPNLFATNQTVNTEFSQTVANTQQVETPFDMAQTQQIMDQILERMDIQLNTEETTLSMQLHPEELGTLQITISAKEGVMTAQFTAESEAVKTVLENQIIQLQDKLDQQNVRVESIEISVATHGFEQNLQQGENSGSYQEEAKKQRVRRIDISSLEQTEDLAEEDRIVAEMMQINGNSVDYMA